jgi:ArsR family transcriptional regulator, lead/cadmium/zinc/bismuth-responsive transcriptional repressor
MVKRVDKDRGSGKEMPTCGDGEHPERELAASGVEEASIERAARMLRAVADAERLKLLELLSREELCVTEIAGVSGQGISTVSQRLRLLRGEGLVKRRRSGKHVFYSLADRHVADLISNVLAHADEPH